MLPPRHPLARLAERHRRRRERRGHDSGRHQPLLVLCRLADTWCAPPDKDREAGRWLVNGFLVLTLVSAGVSAMPASALRSALRPAVDPYLELTGLSQGWGMFAPDPPRHSTQLRAEITYADGTTASWQPPADKDLLGALRSYRWRKWSFAARSDDRPGVQESMARWLAREGDHGGRRPVRVELLRLWQELPAPGASDTDRPWKSRTYLTLDLDAGGPT